MTLHQFAYELFQAAAKLLLVIVIFVPLERLFAARAQRFARQSLMTDLGYYFMGSFVPKLLLILPVSLLAWAMHRAIPSTFYTEVAQLPVWARLVAALVVGDIGFYWAHRWMHEIPALWRFHAIHHAAEEMDWLVNTRAHPVDIVFGRFCGLVPIYALGLAQPSGNHLDTVPLLFALIGSLWGFFVHANIKWRLGWFERVLSTPAFHHWHHTNDGPQFIDKNYAAMLPWIDRLFGTHYLPGHLPAEYGVAETLPGTMGGQLAYPFLQKSALVAPPTPARPI